MSKECLTYIQAKQKLGWGGELAINPNELVNCIQCETMGARADLLDKYPTDMECPADDDIQKGSVKIFGPYNVSLVGNTNEAHTLNVFNPSLDFRVSLDIISHISTNNVGGILFSIDNGNQDTNTIFNLITYAGVLLLTYSENGHQVLLGPLQDGQSMHLEVIYRSGELAVEVIKDGVSELYSGSGFPDAGYSRLRLGSPMSSNTLVYELNGIIIECPYAD